MKVKSFVEAVVEFNHKLLGIEPRAIAPMSDNEVKHLMKALREEVEELGDGHAQEDVIECVDALVDIMYWSIGGLHKLGLTPEQILACCQIVHEQNMEKKQGKVASRAQEGVPDAVKPQGWVSPQERMGKLLFNV
jgi:predicted HAD superfamily Cof-like phosphohydrolase